MFCGRGLGAAHERAAQAGLVFRKGDFMDKKDYINTQNTLIMIHGMLQGLDLAEFIDSINRAETIGPILDPTLYMEGHKKMGNIKKLAEKALELQSVKLR